MRRVGPYRVERELGRGGMGAVYLARRADGAGPAVALKVLGTDAHDPDDRARFTREAEVLARLEHPNLVRVLAHGRDGAQAWLAMELIEGEPLDRRLKLRGPLPAREAAALIRDLARGLAHAHARGVLHRDIKPGNVLVRASDGQPLLADFGLARRLDVSQHLTQTGAVLGTPGYLAPEQCGQGSGYGPATDVYGLGALLYALLTGSPPCTGTTLIATLANVLEVAPRPPSELAPAPERALDALVLRCLEKDPQARYAAADELAAALDRYLAGAARSASPRGARVVAGLALLGVALALGVGLRRSASSAGPTASTSQAAPIPGATKAVATTVPPKRPSPDPAASPDSLDAARQAFARKDLLGGLAASAPLLEAEDPRLRLSALELRVGAAELLMEQPAGLDALQGDLRRIGGLRELSPTNGPELSLLQGRLALSLGGTPGLEERERMGFLRAAFEGAEAALRAGYPPVTAEAARHGARVVLDTAGHALQERSPTPERLGALRWSAERWLEEEPRDLEACYALANVLLTQGHHAACEPYLRQVAERMPLVTTRAWAQGQLVVSLVAQERPAAAFAALQPLVGEARAPRGIRARAVGAALRIGVYLGRWKELPPLIAAARALPGAPPWELDLALGALELEAHRASDALAALERALARAEPSARSELLGLCAQAQGEAGHAAEALRLAREAYPEPRAGLYLACASRQPAETVRLIEGALLARPSPVVAIALLQLLGRQVPDPCGHALQLLLHREVGEQALARLGAVLAEAYPSRLDAAAAPLALALAWISDERLDADRYVQEGRYYAACAIADALVARWGAAPDAARIKVMVGRVHAAFARWCHDRGLPQEGVARVALSLLQDGLGRLPADASPDGLQALLESLEQLELRDRRGLDGAFLLCHRLCAQGLRPGHPDGARDMLRALRLCGPGLSPPGMVPAADQLAALGQALEHPDGVDPERLRSWRREAGRHFALSFQGAPPREAAVAAKRAQRLLTAACAGERRIGTLLDDLSLLFLATAALGEDPVPLGLRAVEATRAGGVLVQAQGLALLAQALARSGRRAEALEQWGRALSLVGGRPRIALLHQRAQLLLFEMPRDPGRAREGLRDAEELLGLEPGAPRALLQRARARTILGERAAARADLELVLRRTDLPGELATVAHRLLRELRAK
ncbi:MAG: protein kinase [Planctomycetota bacterium]